MWGLRVQHHINSVFAETTQDCKAASVFAFCVLVRRRWGEDGLRPSWGLRTRHHINSVFAETTQDCKAAQGKCGDACHWLDCFYLVEARLMIGLTFFALADVDLGVLSQACPVASRQASPPDFRYLESPRKGSLVPGLRQLQISIWRVRSIFHARKCLVALAIWRSPPHEERLPSPYKTVRHLDLDVVDPSRSYESVYLRKRGVPAFADEFCSILRLAIHKPAKRFVSIGDCATVYSAAQISSLPICPQGSTENGPYRQFRSLFPSTSCRKRRHPCAVSVTLGYAISCHSQVQVGHMAFTVTTKGPT
jgi:hypothetical protein